MDLGLKGKKAIVTGGTKGICRALLDILVEEGCDIAFCARSEDDVKATVAELEGKGVKVVGGTANVKEVEGYQQWLKDAAEELGGCDIFVPGVSAGGGMDGEKSWYKAFEIDLMGCVRGFDALFPYMKASGNASVVFISTTAAVETFIAPMPYNSIKASLITYAKQMSQFHGKRGIRFNVVSPGPILIEGGSWAQIRDSDEAFFNSILAQQPDGRMGEADEVAKCIAFLASDAASWVTGTNLIVDGGFTKRVQF
ncbi:MULTISPECIES: SDR family NAD(P)-dependent oxidoreductase [Maritimibacter]|jgi:NAD(P)-dependent dehydrogenase (short-subunit alcohol dehydrogenase family)|uniref:Putative 3-ketoacyl-CoA reductase n=1 Tax=Maritimibacter alkaliphilus HTCC2654 TaxID=314271 RepID=A3VK75_9RHOB|nr:MULTISPECIES: SDR family oxidoreductase [Maritimibacter]EAQ11380.1 putative 3-ketoacyl-CoA reductase [Rhodobacterales bacterium HTCC2654] [Maritimibacter alkaliphilus HTCC2654]MBL6430037.1 SDR family oxidoreductase [Maritimibacter sp.]TYP80086.1 NAD(P)-dependent dehydrogenase (short-subunit alcohol dehydrogenase family) [Maritimibacter alkaliphilus HTCC2654]